MDREISAVKAKCTKTQLVGSPWVIAGIDTEESSSGLGTFLSVRAAEELAQNQFWEVGGGHRIPPHGDLEECSTLEIEVAVDSTFLNARATE